MSGNEVVMATSDVQMVAVLPSYRHSADQANTGARPARQGLWRTLGGVTSTSRRLRRNWLSTTLLTALCSVDGPCPLAETPASSLTHRGSGVSHSQSLRRNGQPRPVTARKTPRGPSTPWQGSPSTYAPRPPAATPASDGTGGRLAQASACYSSRPRRGCRPPGPEHRSIRRSSW